METFAAIFANLVIAGAVGGLIYWRFHPRQPPTVFDVLSRHFRPVALDQTIVAERRFPAALRIELARAVLAHLPASHVVSFVGLRFDERYESGPEFTAMMDERSAEDRDTPTVAPHQYEEIDVGEDEPVRSLKNGLWLMTSDGERYAVMLAPYKEMGSCGYRHETRIQIAYCDGPKGEKIAADLFKRAEAAAERGECYRGKVLSLETEASHRGHAMGLKVHRLGQVSRDQIVLPARTVEMLERNVVDFIANRAGLNQLNMSTKKGLLFYGPPGVGKTHTIRYLSGALREHTTFIVTAEQVEILGQYMTLARALQPSLVVIEDVDLIARHRGESGNFGAEELLNKLLNEMDGLKEDCDVLFILTTNRPEDLEEALASRPGRVDQAIEFPHPDAVGREKLIRLYSGGLVLSDELIRTLVARTSGVGGAFIKELMRRAAQFHLTRSTGTTLALDDAAGALDEMLLGDKFNKKLLGFHAPTAGLTNGDSVSVR